MRTAKIFIALCLVSLSTSAQDRISGHSRATRSEVIAQHGMAATSQPLATIAALDILKAGGNAIDAAIAANAVLGLVEPTGNGIGGDLFAIVWDAESQQLYGLNASGRSPKKLTKQYFLDHGHEKIPSHGPLSVSVPGCVDGWFELHDRFGDIKMKDVLQPAIDYAEDGFPVSELVAYYWNRSAPFLSRFDGFSEVYMPGGKAPQKGDVFKNPALANTLRQIAKDGRDAYYKGDIAKTIASYIKEQGGFLDYEDLASHSSEWIDPVSTNYRGHDVWELPPNGQGIAVLQMLNLLEHFDIREMGYGSAEYIHLFTEVKKLVYEDRAKYYADPAFGELPIDHLISKAYAKKRLDDLNPDRAARRYDAAELNHGETIYLTTADKHGNMVSLIQSNFRGMGSGMTPPGLGFILQDRGELFTLEDGHHNEYEPGKRPFHTIIPAFITKDGRPWVSFGLMGGAMQPQGHVQIVLNLVDFDMNLQEAGDVPRMQHLGSSQPTGEVMTNGGTLYLESGIDSDVIRQLLIKGHKISWGLSYGGYQAIMWDDERGVYFGASESRKDGMAAGY